MHTLISLMQDCQWVQLVKGLVLVNKWMQLGLGQVPCLAGCERVQGQLQDSDQELEVKTPVGVQPRLLRSQETHLKLGLHRLFMFMDHWQ